MIDNARSIDDVDLSEQGLQMAAFSLPLDFMLVALPFSIFISNRLFLGCCEKEEIFG